MYIYIYIYTHTHVIPRPEPTLSSGVYSNKPLILLFIFFACRG